MTTLQVRLRHYANHPGQKAFIESNAKRKVIRAGRRGGKTTGAAILALQAFLQGHRVLYAVPTQEQVDRFWSEVKRALAEPLERGVFYKNETRHIIELPKTEQRIRAKTAWDADTLRGDYADLLILDEFQLMKPDAWGLVGAPMLLDGDGDAVFIYTSKRGKNHTKELYKKAQVDKSGRWEVFCFSSHDNPYLSKDALGEIVSDMTKIAYRMEILAEDIEDDPRALWSRRDIHHVTSCPDLLRIVVGVDPPGKEDRAECGIIVAGIAKIDGVVHGYVLDDRSLQGKPGRWGREVVTACKRNKANIILAEVNFGGDMVASTIKVIDKSVQVKVTHATRGKAVRADPIAAYYEKGQVHHVGEFSELEDEMCLVADTLVYTNRGAVPIQNILVGDMVLTRTGYRSVLWGGLTSISAKIIEIRTNGGRNLFATVGHPVYNPSRGFIPAGDLSAGDTLEVMSWVNMELRSPGMAESGMSIIAATTWTETESCYIGRYGLPNTGRSRRDISCITEMRTGSTILSRILSYLQSQSIARYIPGPLSRRRKEEKRVRPGGRSASQEHLSAPSAAENFNQQEFGRHSAIANVTKDTVAELIPITEQFPVYNLAVDGEEYFANGILVHNCNWTPSSGMPSPNRIDALVWALTELMIRPRGRVWRC